MNIKLFLDDCLNIMNNIPDKSVDLILCDLPYGTTPSKWDNIIPFDVLWNHYKRIIKPKHAILLFGVEPFSSKLRLSNLEWYKYDWIWIKNIPVGFVNAKLKPMPKHEIISVFSDGKTANCNKNNMIYYPQGLLPFNKTIKSKRNSESLYNRPSNIDNKYYQEFTNYPTTDLYFAKDKPVIHPTQKPVALLEYLIKTYTKEGETVLDNCMGTGSTGVACKNTNRNFIGIEKEEKYFNIAKERIYDS